MRPQTGVLYGSYCADMTDVIIENIQDVLFLMNVEIYIYI